MTEKVLCVDDDESVLAGYHRRLRKDFQIEVATSGAAGLTSLKAKGPFAVIVSDMRMPGMDGIQFLSQAKALAPDSARIMLTGYCDQQVAINAVNEGNIFRFLTKPCETDTLTRAIAAGVTQYKLVTAEKELLGQTLRGSVRLLIDVLALINPAAFGRASRVRRLVRALAQALHVEHSWEFDMAAMLSQLGCVTLPPDVMEKLRRGEPLSAEEARMVAAHPQVGHDLVARIPRLEHVADVIAQQDLCFDGGGAPPHTKHGEQIPLAARVLKVALDYDTLKSTGLTSLTAWMRLEDHRSRYDPQVLAALQCVAQAEEAQEIRELSAEDLADHMVLADDVVGPTGTLILSRGQEVTPHLRERLRNYARRAAIREPIRVFTRVESGEAGRG